MSAAAVHVNTKKVRGRRRVRYESYEEFLRDAERLATADVRLLGNWTRAQIYDHLATSLDMSVDGADFSMPAPVRWVMNLLFRKKFLNVALPPGFRATGKFIPDDRPVDESLAALRQAIERQGKESSRASHPAFGDIGREGWDKFNLRHAELHMSFIAEA